MNVLQPQGSGSKALQPIDVEIEADLEGRLVRRYKRFLADVLLADGREITVHCPNPGRMLGTQTPGADVRLSTHDDPRRKLRHTLEMIRVGPVWVGLHAARANEVARRALVAGAYAPLTGYPELQPEARAPEGSRFDFRLARPTTDGADGERAVCWVEVKSVTLCEGGRARFPDAVTERGRRHLEHLVARVRTGERAVLLFIAQRADADSVAPADEIDPAYGEALRAAVDAGVEIHALSARVSPSAIRLERTLPVLL